MTTPKEHVYITVPLADRQLCTGKTCRSLTRFKCDVCDVYLCGVCWLSVPVHKPFATSTEKNGEETDSDADRSPAMVEVSDEDQTKPAAAAASGNATALSAVVVPSPLVATSALVAPVTVSTTPGKTKPKRKFSQPPPPTDEQPAVKKQKDARGRKSGSKGTSNVEKWLRASLDAGTFMGYSEKDEQKWVGPHDYNKLYRAFAFWVGRTMRVPIMTETYFKARLENITSIHPRADGQIEFAPLEACRHMFAAYVKKRTEAAGAANQLTSTAAANPATETAAVNAPAPATAAPAKAVYAPLSAEAAALSLAGTAPPAVTAAPAKVPLSAEAAAASVAVAASPVVSKPMFVDAAAVPVKPLLTAKQAKERSQHLAAQRAMKARFMNEVALKIDTASGEGYQTLTFHLGETDEETVRSAMLELSSPPNNYRVEFGRPFVNMMMVNWSDTDKNA